MAKALYGVYFVFALGFVGMGYSFFTASKDIEQNAFSCLRLPQAEIDKCMDGVTQHAATLRKAAAVFTGQN
ncbi:hypothetical protein [Pseudomonas sp. GM80]|uniref:hypothetical protein n=1 Tax=Pseudomonas sp. GM80 TaxID=1144339 RepID=UPI00026FD0A4|nr:hypothetical protein [Pseudomonas sp. GM80]EJN36286.1 hypothetical protein PMI37_00068 [Pseudomonas sp. GM80]